MDTIWLTVDPFPNRSAERNGAFPARDPKWPWWPSQYPAGIRAGGYPGPDLMTPNVMTPNVITPNVITNV